MPVDDREREELEDAERPRIRITDKRRVRPEGEEPSGAPAPSEEPVPEAAAGGPDELEAARREAAEYRDHLQRMAAEFENFRKRTLKEQTRAVEMAAEPLIRRLLEVLDEFDLALMAAERKPDFDKFLRGVELVYAKLVDILRAEGLEPMDATGKPFDPERHEALMHDPNDTGHGEQVVADELRRGYTLRGRVIRPSGVKVTHR